MSTPRFNIGDRVEVAVSGLSSPKGRRGTVRDLDIIPWIHFDDYNPAANPNGDTNLGIPEGHKDSILEGLLKPIETTNPMSDELKITKAAVLEAASKCSTAKATLQVLFPDAFKPSDEPFEFKDGDKLDSARVDSVPPLFIGFSLAPPGLRYKCLIVNEGWEMRQQEYEGMTVLIFHRKP